MIGTFIAEDSEACHRHADAQEVRAESESEGFLAERDEHADHHGEARNEAREEIDRRESLRHELFEIELRARDARCQGGGWRDLP